jgi:polyisoprenyl-teichoic acid--peptidoglycan teichoic acid transferase
MGNPRVLLRALGLTGLVTAVGFVAGAAAILVLATPALPLQAALGSPTASVRDADAAPSVQLGRNPPAAQELPTAAPASEPGSLAVPATPTAPPVPMPARIPALRPLIPGAGEPTSTGWGGTRRMNLLLVGLDRRPDETVGRTDTIVLLRIDLDTGTAGMLSIPRDLVVDIPGYGQDRVNSAYPLGEARRAGAGIELLEATLLRNFQVPVDHYAVVDFQCFRGAVDAAGGVSVEVPKHILDTRYPTDDYGFKTVEFLPGRQVLDGERALEYARTRHADSDFDRMRRQQQILFGLRQQLIQPRALTAAPGIVRACWGTSSDLSFADMVSLGMAARGIDVRQIAGVTLDERVARPYTTPQGASVLLPDWPAVRERVAQIFPPTTAQVQNGG